MCWFCENLFFSAVLKGIEETILMVVGRCHTCFDIHEICDTNSKWKEYTWWKFSWRQYGHASELMKKVWETSLTKVLKICWRQCLKKMSEHYSRHVSLSPTKEYSRLCIQPRVRRKSRKYWLTMQVHEWGLVLFSRNSLWALKAFKVSLDGAPWIQQQFFHPQLTFSLTKN